MIESIHKYLIVLWFGIVLGTTPTYAVEVQKNGGQDAASSNDSSADAVSPLTPSDSTVNAPAGPSSNRTIVLIGSLTIFVLAVFVGFEVINKVPPTLHTPLMSGSNAISGITIVGAILATGFQKFGFGSLMGFAAVVLAMINVAGGFWVTHRMLVMFKKK